MNKGFVFEIDGEDEDEKKVQSPWEFSGFSASVNEEYAERNTTSIDHKISQVRSSKNYYKHGGEEEEEDESDEEEQERLQKKAGGSSRREKKWGEKGVESGSIGRGKKVAGDESELEDDIGLETGMWEDESEVSDGEAEDGEDSKEEDDESASEVDMDDDDDDDEEEDVKEDVDEDGEVQEIEQGLQEKVSGSPKSVKSRKERKAMQKVHVENIHGADKDEQASTFFSSSEGASFSAKSFGELNLSKRLIRACEALGYKEPTPIQAACIPLALTGRDICGSAVTGSGKTGAFALPMLERLLWRPRRIPAIRCLILTPTRELAVQVQSMVQKLGQFTDVTSCLVVGGLSSKVQEVALRARPDIVVATPGRMIDHLQNSLSVGLEDLSILVLDEADRLLELGFTKEVHELVRQCPKIRQTMLFSATMTEKVAALINLSLNRPVRLSADPSTKRPTTLSEEVVKIRPDLEGDKEAVLLALCSRLLKSSKKKVIVFSGTKLEAHRLKILFGLSGLKAAELHGNLTQAMRLDALESFRTQQVDFLIATDVAARGLDIVGVETVINYQCPSDITIYVHRVGRTARAGRNGCALTFVTKREGTLLKAIAKKAGSKLKNHKIDAVAIYKWRSKIEEMEDGVREVMQAEREERALRKAEMEANKAQNIMEHEKEIYSRPKREWFQTTKEKRTTAAASKAGKEGQLDRSPGTVSSVQEADEVKQKDKRKKEQEKNTFRKKRRRLEAEREDAYGEPDSEGDEDQSSKPLKKLNTTEEIKSGSKSLVDLAYRRAKAAKSVEKLVKAGKIGPQKKIKGKPSESKTKSRKAETEELFEGDFGEDKRQKVGKSGPPKKPTRKPGVSKRAFKSKSRYKRRK